MHIELQALVSDFARGLMLADSKRPQAVNIRSGTSFQPGIGPHSETQTVELVMKELSGLSGDYGSHSCAVPYPQSPRRKCDLCIGQEGKGNWVIEVKMIRFLGDNGKINDNILMHVLSPYSEHRSALTDCEKLVESGFDARKAILIYGYDHDEWPLDPAVNAFEILAGVRVDLGARCTASFSGLNHPVHSRGRVFGWELKPKTVLCQ